MRLWHTELPFMPPSSTGTLHKYFTKIFDVTPRSLGIFCIGDHFSVVVPVFTKTPVILANNFCTAVDFQTRASIEVHEGENPIASRSLLLGKFTLADIPPAWKGVEPILVKTEIDDNGILSVTATVISTKVKKTLTIEKQKYCLGKRVLDDTVCLKTLWYLYMLLLIFLERTTNMVLFNFHFKST
jgi:molecular chaperone DnaK (HSP70)